MEFVLVVDAVVSLFWSWVGAGIGEQVIHLVQKIDLVFLQVLAYLSILIAEVYVLEPTVELPKIRCLVVNILTDRCQEFIHVVSIYRNDFERSGVGRVFVGREVVSGGRDVLLTLKAKSN